MMMRSIGGGRRIEMILLRLRQSAFAQVFQWNRVKNPIALNEGDVTGRFHRGHVRRQRRIPLIFPSRTFALPVGRRLTRAIVRRSSSSELLLMSFVTFCRGVFHVDFFAVENVRTRIDDVIGDLRRRVSDEAEATR